MTTVTREISQPIHRALEALTHQSRFDAALSIAMKDWIRLKLREVIDERHSFEQKYSMNFAQFKIKWHTDEIPDRYSWEVESDYWDWEGAVTEEEALLELRKTLT